MSQADFLTLLNQHKVSGYLQTLACHSRPIIIIIVIIIIIIMESKMPVFVSHLSGQGGLGFYGHRLCASTVVLQFHSNIHVVCQLLVFCLL